MTRLMEVTLESASGRRSVRISDLSLGGCFIDTISDLKTGERSRFEIKRPGGRSIVFTGLVAYSMHNVGFGLKFDELSREQKDFLTQACGVTETGEAAAA